MGGRQKKKEGRGVGDGLTGQEEEKREGKQSDKDKKEGEKRNEGKEEKG